VKKNGHKLPVKGTNSTEKERVRASLRSAETLVSAKDIHGKENQMKGLRNLVFALLVVLLLSAGANLQAQGKGKPPKDDPGDTPPPDPNPTITFSREGNFSTFDLMVMNPDGTNQVAILAESNVSNVESHWGPNGWLAFVREPTTLGPGGVYAIHADGTGLRLLAETASWDWTRLRFRGVDWSPNGKWIVYSDLDADSEAVTEDFNLHLLPVDWIDNEPSGGTPVQLTFTPGILEVAPSWSPDSTRVAAEAGEAATFFDENAIYVFDLKFDESDVRECLDPAAGLPCIVDQQIVVDGSPAPVVLEPVWAQSHDWIAFQADSDGDGASGLWIVDLTNGNLLRVHEEFGFRARSPAWSADDQSLVYRGSGTQDLKRNQRAAAGLYLLQLNLTHDGVSILDISPEAGHGTLLFEGSAQLPHWRRSP
jgi:hypothetical protein